ncbi:hypothetical protein NLU13_5071 [Sarocladium strictum]|uniref:Uncharacterized protein n=1 Tax=Sarocladium strictum TaxID=5046 RepID=A0AA39GLH8_SARSR|nr:hypothetical protein NLU13_5071 [Sarocladium strictum]
MPLEQTITIVNNSGKIISTGKELFSIFKDAKESYLDKKAEIKTLQRAQTFDQTRSVSGRGRESVYDYDPYRTDRALPRRSFDEYSEASSKRSYRTRSVRSYHHGADAVPRSRPALTEYNLKTLSEVSSVAPSRAPPNAYRSPFAETMTRDLADARSMAITERRPSGQLARRRSLSELDQNKALVRKPKEIDMDLAYGSMPPDLEHMVELDPNYDDGKKAKLLVRKVEGLLTECDCLKHSAGAIIKRLQEDPNAAASVALTLTELSKVVGKMSPAVLPILKGSSPAVFALLASPQFLIGTSIVAGVTVIMFGGWKIVKKVRENQVAREALGYEGVPDGRPAPLRTQSEVSAGFDEALIVDDELSTIESWRRGIAPFGDDASADMELITPQADRVQRERADDDTRSRRTAKTAKTAKSGRSVKTHKSSKTTREDRDHEVPERKSSRRATAESVSGASERSSSSRKKHHSSSSSSSKSKRKEVRAIEDGKSHKDDAELVMRPKMGSGSNMLKAIFKNKEREKSLVTA